MLVFIFVDAAIYWYWPSLISCSLDSKWALNGLFWPRCWRSCPCLRWVRSQILVDGGSLHGFGGSLMVGVVRGRRCGSLEPLLMEIREVDFVGKFSTMVAYWTAISMGVLGFNLGNVIDKLPLLLDWLTKFYKRYLFWVGDGRIGWNSSRVDRRSLGCSEFWPISWFSRGYVLLEAGNCSLVFGAEFIQQPSFFFWATVLLVAGSFRPASKTDPDFSVRCFVWKFCLQPFLL